MASGVKFKWSKAGYDEVMNDPGIQSMLHEYGEEVCDRATSTLGSSNEWRNPPYMVFDDMADSGNLAGRPVVHVAAINPESMYMEYKTHNLKKAL